MPPVAAPAAAAATGGSANTNNRARLLVAVAVVAAVALAATVAGGGLMDRGAAGVATRALDNDYSAPNLQGVWKQLRSATPAANANADTEATAATVELLQLAPPRAPPPPSPPPSPSPPPTTTTTTAHSFLTNPDARDDDAMLTAMRNRVAALFDGKFELAKSRSDGLAIAWAADWDGWLRWVPRHAWARDLYTTFGSNERIRSCLANKRLYLVGTSYMRVLMLELMRVLGERLTPEMVFTGSNDIVTVKGVDCDKRSPLPARQWKQIRSTANAEEMDTSSAVSYTHLTLPTN